MHFISDKNFLMSLLHQDATVITPNSYLSDEVIRGFFETNSQSVQEKPNCLTYSIFLRECYKTLCYHEAKQPHPLLITTYQLRHLWRQILARDTQIAPNEGLINKVDEAWSHYHNWQLSFDHPDFSHTPQSQQFRLWALTLQNELTQHKAVTEVQLAQYLMLQTYPRKHSIIVWACFNEFTPQQRMLQKYLSEQGCELYEYDLGEQVPRQYQYIANDSQDEAQQLIHWLKEQLDEKKGRIGVVVPDLANQVKPLQRLLEQQFTPDQFNFYINQPLLEYSLVAHALSWLQIDSNLLTIHQAQLLVNSPYTAYSHRELLARAQFTEESIVLQEPYCNPIDLSTELNNFAPKLAELIAKLKPYPVKAPLQTWIKLYKNRLKSLGFPGESPLNPITQRGYERFIALFSEFQQLSLFTPALSGEEAYKAFADLTKKTFFHPKSSRAPIRIITWQEASGACFDSLWVSNFTDEALPLKAKASAFIPRTLQQNYGLPHICPKHEFALAQKTLWRLQQSSPLIIFSYPRYSNDKPNLPSPLLNKLNPYSPIATTVNRKNSLETWSENYFFPEQNYEKAKGGTAILTNQAKCPFRAFAAHRLHVKEMRSVSQGLDAREKGQLIHKVLELFWRDLQDQHALLRLSEDKLRERVEQSIQLALQPLKQRRPYSFSALIEEIEFSRLKKLVHDFLSWEIQRPFFTVKAIEEKYQFSLAGINFNLRIDRLDEVEGGKKWVIDYKSSLPKSTPWNEERPQEPQLLAYALLDQTINTLLFAQLKTGHISFKGLSENAVTVPGLTSLKKDSSWAYKREQWKIKLTELADEFHQGSCEPRPASSTVCQQCSYQSLCRYNRSSVDNEAQ